MALQYFGAMGESESNHSGLKRKLASTRQHNISVVPCSDRAASRCWVRLARGPREHPMPPGVPCPVAQKSAPPRRACPSTDGPRPTPVPCPRRRVALLSSGSGTKTRARRPAAASQGHSAQLPAPAPGVTVTRPLTALGIMSTDGEGARHRVPQASRPVGAAARRAPRSQNFPWTCRAVRGGRLGGSCGLQQQSHSEGILALTPSRTSGTAPCSERPPWASGP